MLLSVRRVGPRVRRAISAWRRIQAPHLALRVSRARRAALEMLADARDVTGMPIVTELMDARDIDAVDAVADVIQIGARNMQNFSLLAAVGERTTPVLLKRGIRPP